MHQESPVNGYVLIQARSREDIPRLADRVAGVPGVVKAQRVNGPYDLIAELSESETEVRALPSAAIAELDGILRVIPLALASGADVPTDARGAAA
jgi:DNA-binding Lrp family transcriptional regulator